MEKPKFLYIDDENDASVAAVVDGFNDEGQIEVVSEKPQDFKLQRKYLAEKLVEFDGLLLDLRLDQNMQLDVAYNAPALAQELRTDVSNPDVSMVARPIVLCSTHERMRATYDADKASHDLFDYKFLKGADPDWPRFSRKLNSLARGYKSLNEVQQSINDVLQRSDLQSVDPRIVEKFMDPEKYPLVYDYAHFVIKSLFNHPGPLIKERVMAARFGVSIEKSGEAWISFKERILKEARYIGLFHDGWYRWWSDKVNDIFKRISGGKRLAGLNAKQRVEILVSCGVKGLVPAEPIVNCKSTQFWTICEGYKTPLDPLEGFKVYQAHEPKAWQEPKYISLDAVVNRVGREKGLRPHPSEESKIELLKEVFYRK